MSQQIGSRQGRSLAGRAVVAVLLTIGFYGLAVVIAVALFAVPVLEWNLIHRVTGQLAAACVIGGGLILWSLVPRRQRFVAPGPELTPEQNPRLFERLAKIARTVREPMPKEVYLTAEVNAAVFQRGGVLGIGGHRAMIVGLPLFQTLNTSEFEGVLVHEFGHYYGGDVKLGPWIYRTRETIGRTIHNLRGRQLLQVPFLAYGTQFLRVTQAISRQQEFAADALAARTVGAGSLISGLKRIHRAALAFNGYWAEEYVPVLQSGYTAPLLAGFDQFMRQEKISGALDEAITSDMERPNPDPFDSHPTLADRIAALQALPAGPDHHDDEPAISLLGEPSSAERAVVDDILRRNQRTGRPLGWDEVGEAVFLPRARETATKFGTLVGSASVADLPAQVQRAVELGRQMEVKAGQTLANDGMRRQWGLFMLADLVTASLAANGWTVQAPVGAPVGLHRDGKAIEPTTTISRMASGEVTADAWRDTATSLGIADLPLDETGARPAP